MSIKEEWQLVAHKPKTLTLSQLAIAHAIARRLPNAESVRIPQRTLLQESGIKSSGTVVLALKALEEAGLIKVTPSVVGSRKANLITWLLTCPEGCQVDHQNANTRIPKKPISPSGPEKSSRSENRGVSRSENRSALRIDKKEREGSLVSFIRETLLELDSPSPLQAQLLEAAQDLKTSGLVNTQAELIIVSKNPESAYSYLKAIALKDPHKLLPKPAITQAPQSFEHLPPGDRELELAKLTRPDPFAAQKALAND